jgi:hypothetical protein
MSAFQRVASVYFICGRLNAKNGPKTTPDVFTTICKLRDKPDSYSAPYTIRLFS